MFDRCTVCTDDATSKGAGLFCRRHWSKLPVDLRERVRWALDEDDEIELRAALTAAREAL